MNYFRLLLRICFSTLMVNVVFLDSGLTQDASFSSSLDTKLESQTTGNFLSLLGKLSVPGPTADILGYANADKEYALVGYGIFTDPPNAGVVIVDVSNPANPVQVADINTVPGFDVKTWQNYMYSVNGRSDGFGGIVDILDTHFQRPESSIKQLASSITPSFHYSITPLLHYSTTPTP